MRFKLAKIVALLLISLSFLISVEVYPQAKSLSPVLQTTVGTERPFYAQGELVKITGNTTDTTGTPISGSTVALEVHDTSSNTIFLDITTTYMNGSFSDSFRLAIAAPSGTYTVYAVASKAGYVSARNQTTFGVGSSTGIAFAVWTQKSQYMRFENVLAYGRVLYNRTALQNALVTFNIVFPNGTNWITLANMTDATGTATQSFNLPPTIPAGQYQINASSHKDAYPNATATGAFTIQNREPIIYQVTVNPQVIEKPGSTNIQANALDYEDYLNLTLMCIITFPNQTVQILNMTLANSLFTFQYPILSTYPSGTYTLTVRAVDHDAGSCDYQTTFEVTTPVLKGSAYGWATNSTGQAIMNATFTLSLKTAYLTYKTNADSQGFYSLASIMPGQYSLITSAPAYVTNTTDIEIVGNQSTYENVTLKHLPILTGWVIMQNGASIPNATVTATDGQQVVGQAQTDNNGLYQVVPSASGTFTITASAYGYSRNSTMLTCLLDQSISANFSLVQNGKLVGTLIDSMSGNPIPNATTLLYGGSFVESENTNSTGQFTYDSVSPGSYTLFGEASGYLSNMTTVTLYSNQTTAAQVTLAPTGNITGTVREAAGHNPLEGATVFLMDYRGVALTAALTDSSGNYLFYLVQPGIYTVKVCTYGYNTTLATVSVAALTVTVANFTLIPSIMNLDLEASSSQYSRGETASLTVGVTNAQGQSIANNTSITLIMRGPNNETRNLNYSQQGDHFTASYAIPSNETMGEWAVTVAATDDFGNHAETTKTMNIMEPFLVQFSADKPSYVNGEEVNFTAYVVRYGNLTRFLNSTEVLATEEIQDPQNNTVAVFNLTSRGNALTGQLDTTGLPKGVYMASLNINDSGGNTKTVTTAFAVVQDFHITVSTDKDFYNRTETVLICGSISFTNGTIVANTSVSIILTVKNYARSFYTTSDNSGNFEYAFRPLGIDAGNYTLICTAQVEGIERSGISSFVLLGLALKPDSLTISMPQNSAGNFSIEILNTGEATLTGVTANITPSLADGVTITILANPQDTIIPNENTYFAIQVTAGLGAIAQTEFNLTVSCNQNAVEYGKITVDVFPAIPILKVVPQIIDVSLRCEGFLTRTIELTNIGYVAVKNITITSPTNSWISLTRNHVDLLAPYGFGVSESFDVMIHPTNDTPVGLYQDQITLLSDNNQPVNVYITVKVTTVENGSLVFHVVDDTGLAVPNATVSLQYQEYWLQAQTCLTNSTGYYTFPSLIGGRYSYTASAEDHETTSGTTIVQPASTVYVEVACPIQKMGVSLDVLPITIGDQYFVMLNMTFETDIPQPMLIPCPPVLQFEADIAKVYTSGFDSNASFKLDNTGLISVFNVSISVDNPLPAGYDISLGDFGKAISLNEILGGGEIEVPCRLIIQHNTTINELPNGVVGKIKIEGYFVYFDSNQNAKRAKVNAEVIVRIVNKGVRNLCVNPSIIYAVERSGVISFSPGKFPERLPDVVITNCASGESVSVFTLATGGGIKIFAGLPPAIGFFWVFGLITRYGNLPGQPVTLVNAKDTFGLVSADFGGGPLYSLLVQAFLKEAWDRSTIGELELAPTSSAVLSDESWSLTTKIIEELLGVEVGIGVEVTVGGIVFSYQWMLDTRPSFYFVPILIFDYRFPSISIPVLAWPSAGGGGPPWQSWCNGGSTGVVSAPSISYETGSGTWAPTGGNPQQAQTNTTHEIVKLSISQQATLERDAFQANLHMTNKMPSTEIDNVRAVLSITFTNGSDARQNFYFNVSSLQGISDVDGTGIIQPSATAVASWLIIPKPGAGGTGNEGVYYMIQAQIFYTVNQMLFNLSSSVETINVQPQPNLALDYYLPQKVTANVPFKLGIRVTNTGYGIAHNFKIDSAQPVIYENLAHLLINFALIGSYVQGTQVSNSLKMVFGDIYPGETVIGYWLMVSTLNGTFTEFTATYTHSSALGGEETSLITVHAYILMRDVTVNQTGLWFLVDTNNDTVGDQVVNSCSGESSPVALATYNITQQNGTSLTIQTQKNQTWIWLAVSDPFNNQKQIVQIQRSDGKVLDPQNYWMAEGRIFIVDDPEQNYTILYNPPPDIAVIGAELSKTIVGQGYSMHINVTVQNLGNFTENFNVTTYADSFMINQTQLSLPTATTIVLTIRWNTTGFAKGNYSISAYASPVEGETDTADNSFTGGWVVVSMVGDLTGGTPNAWDFVPDGKVGGVDVSVVARCFGSSPDTVPPMRWEPNCDLNNNGHVDGADVATVARHFGESEP